MTMLKPDRVMPALEPVRAELLRRAAADAQRLIAEANDEAASIVERAYDTARQMAENARAAGESAGEMASAEEGAALRRTLRRQLLAAQNNVYRQWRRRGTEAVLALRDDPDYSRWLEMLRGTAKAALGADAQLADSPAGGIVAHLGNRQLDLSLSAIAARALDRLAPEADGLWS